MVWDKISVERIFEDHPHKGVFYSEHDRWNALREAAARDNDLVYTIGYNDESLDRVVNDAIGRGFILEGMALTRENNPHLKLRHKNYNGFGRIIREKTSNGFVYQLYEPVE